MKWDVSALNALREKSGVSLESVSKATGISLQSLYAYANGRISPGVSTLIALADYYAVPLDYLVGRLPEDKAREIIDHYSETFMELRKAPYEAYLYGRREPKERKVGGGQPPWPYNLLDAVFRDGWQEVLTDDQRAGLDHALKLLNERSQGLITAYYKEGRTLEETGKMFSVTRERARQILSKACHSLRHPSRAGYIIYGLSGVKRMNRCEEESRRLAELEDKLALKETELRLRLQRLEGKESDIQEREQQFSDYAKDFYARRGEMSIYDMDMSVRSTNILKRRGARTLSDVVTILDTGRFHTLRGVGKAVLGEVTSKVSILTGKDYSTVYNI